MAGAQLVYLLHWWIFIHGVGGSFQVLAFTDKAAMGILVLVLG